MYEDDKTRRNLVVVSAVVLALYWLEIPEGTILKKLAGDGFYIEGKEWKIWLLVCVIVVYLFHRYWSDMGKDSVLQEAKEIFHNECVAHVKSSIGTQARFLSEEIKSAHWFQTNPVVDEGPFTEGTKNLKIEWPKSKLTQVHTSRETAWVGTAEFLSAHQSSFGSPRGKASYKVPTLMTMLIASKIFIKFAKTKYLTKIGAPVVLAFGANVVASFKFGTSLYARFF